MKLIIAGLIACVMLLSCRTVKTTTQSRKTQVDSTVKVIDTTKTIITSEETTVKKVEGDTLTIDTVLSSLPIDTLSKDTSDIKVIKEDENLNVEVIINPKTKKLRVSVKQKPQEVITTRKITIEQRKGVTGETNVTHVDEQKKEIKKTRPGVNWTLIWIIIVLIIGAIIYLYLPKFTRKRHR